MTTVPQNVPAGTGLPGLSPGAGLRAGGSPGESKIGGLLTLPQVFLSSLLVVGLTFLFWHWLLRQHWMSLRAPSDWGHAYVIPFISVYLLWREREQIVRTRISTFWPGVLPFLLGIGAYFVSVVVIKNHMIQGLSIVLTIAGLALWLTGPRMFRILFLPIAYLVFAITISEMIMIKITFQLQLIASQGAGFMLGMLGPLLGFAVEVDGNTLKVTPKGGHEIPLNVAEACSGMRMVIAFIALAGAVALISAKHWWQRVAVIALALPVAIFMNVIRVAVLGIASTFDGELAKGDAHMMIGTLLLLPGLLLFLGIVWALAKIVEEAPATGKPVAVPVRSTVGWAAMRRPSYLLSLAIMVVCGAGMTAGIHYAGIHLRKKPIEAPGNRALISLPTETPHWKQVGTDKLESAEVEETLGTKNYITRNFIRKDRKPDEQPIELQLHAAYYTGGVDTVPHIPERCYVGGGMTALRTEVLPLKLDASLWSPHTGASNSEKSGWFRQRVPNWSPDGAGSSVTLPREPETMKLRITEFAATNNVKGPKLYAGYLFVANGGHVSSAEEVRLLAFDLKSDYAYYLKVQFTSRTVQSPEELADQASSLMGELLPEIMRCVPDWVEVEAGNYPVKEDSKDAS
ncbi:MAG: exosortase/archaeosortase family protein [Phycisphaerales bacterium]|nr:exosortase/archaeosortase family protein [Phycisphaerales bacterium]